jgi:hypothetical protein
MPNIKRVRFPDGSVRRIQVPDGATREQALAYAKRVWQNEADARLPPLDGEKPAWQPKRRTLADIREEAAKPENHTPTAAEELGWRDAFVASAGKAFRDAGLGTVQALASGGPSAALARAIAERISPAPAGKLGDLITGQPPERSKNAVERWADAAINDNAAADAELMERPGSGWGYAAGLAAPILLPGAAASEGGALAMRAPQLASGLRTLLLPSRLPGMAAQGATLGYLQPVREGDSRAVNTALGTVAAPLGMMAARGAVAAAKGVGRFGQYAAGVVSPNVARHARQRALDQSAADALRAEAEDAASLLRPAPSAVPGASRSLAEESQDAGIARMEQKFRGTASGWDARDAANDAARREAIEAFAGNGDRLEQAIDARWRATQPALKEALQVTGVDTTRLVSQVARLEKRFEKRPAIRKALGEVRELLMTPVEPRDAKRNALAVMRAYLDSGRARSPADHRAVDEAMKAIRRGEVPTVAFPTPSGKGALKLAQAAMQQTEAPESRMAALEDVRRTIQDMLTGKWSGDTNQALKGAQELIAVKNQLTRVMQKASPAFDQYLTGFKALSRPVDQMLIGQRLLRKGAGSPVPGARLTPAAFARQSQNLDDVAAKATRFRKAKAANILTSAQLDTIRNVEDDLARQHFAATRGLGSNSVTDARRELGNRLQQRALARFFFKDAAELLDKETAAQLNARINEMLQNPAEARRILNAMPPKNRALVEQAINRLGGFPAVFGTRASQAADRRRNEGQE